MAGRVRRDLAALEADLFAQVEDQHRRMVSISLAARQRTEELREDRQAKEFCDKLFPFYTEMRSWANISDRDHQLLPKRSTTTPTIPISTEHNCLRLWKFISLECRFAANSVRYPSETSGKTVLLCHSGASSACLR